MSVSRRLFLGGALAVAASTAVPIASSLSLPVLYSNGVDDDWAAIDAVLNGRPFRTLDGFSGIATHGELSGGNFIISRPVLIPKGIEHFFIRSCRIATSPNFVGEAMLIFQSGSISIANNLLLKRSVA